MMRAHARTHLFLLASAFLAAVPLAQPLAASAATAVSQSDSSAEIARLYDAGLYEQAMKVLHAAIEASPMDASLHGSLGRCYYQLRDYNHASSSLERAVALDPNNSDYHEWLGKAYGRRAEQSNPFSALSLARKAHKEFTEAVRLNPSNLAAQRDLIRYLLDSPGIAGGGQDRADEQIEALTKVDAVEGQLARAEADITRKKFDLADEAYQKLLESHPRRIGVDMEIAEYYRDRGDGQHMEQAVDAAAALDPSDVRLSYYRGVALVIAKKDPVKAEQLLRTYLDTVPNNSELPPRSSAREWLGRLYEQEDKRDNAAEQYQAGLALDPGNKTLRDGLRRVQKK